MDTITGVSKKIKDGTTRYLQETYRRKGRMLMSGDLFGFLVSDLFPRSISVSRRQFANRIGR